MVSTRMGSPDADSKVTTKLAAVTSRSERFSTTKRASPSVIWPSETTRARTNRQPTPWARVTRSLERVVLHWNVLGPGVHKKTLRHWKDSGSPHPLPYLGRRRILISITWAFPGISFLSRSYRLLGWSRRNYEVVEKDVSATLNFGAVDLECLDGRPNLAVGRADPEPIRSHCLCGGYDDLPDSG